MDFESKIFRGFYIPGAILWLLMIIMCVLPDEFTNLSSISYLNYPISGVAGMAVGLTLLPATIQVLILILAVSVFSIIIPITYYFSKTKFISVIRTFLLLGDITFFLLLLQILMLFLSLTLGQIENYVNLPVVLVIIMFVIILLAFFMYWTVALYRAKQIKFWSKKTGVSVAYTIAIYFVPTILIFLFLIL